MPYQSEFGAPSSKDFELLGSAPVSDDEQLLRAAIAGDPDALTWFVRETQAQVWRYCAYLGRGEDPADLVQETYARALRALPRFEGRSAVRVWLLGIARRVCADAIRSARRRRALVARFPRSSEVADASDGVSLDLLLQALPVERREALVLTQVIGMPYADAAAVCRVPVGTIRSRVARAREDLRVRWTEAAG